MHNATFAKLGLDYACLAFDNNTLEDAVKDNSLNISLLFPQ
ncbi:hypothetical protein [Clostridium saccharoperbutylacetonicum]